jgi:hypothetical protein
VYVSSLFDGLQKRAYLRGAKKGSEVVVEPMAGNDMVLSPRVSKSLTLNYCDKCANTNFDRASLKS